MSRTTSLGLAALAASLVAAAPAAADPGHGRWGSLRPADLRDVPARVALKLKKAERALDRAEGYAEDGEPAKAAAAFRATRSNLASALKATNKRVAADADDAEAAAEAVSIVEHDIVGSLAGDFDGADDAIVGPVATTLDAAIDGRDSLIAAIAGLDDTSDYEDALSSMADDLESEMSDLADTLDEDDLSTEATAALTGAATKTAASAVAVDALLQALSAGDEEEDDPGLTEDGEDSEDLPFFPGPPRGPGGRH